MVQSTWESCKHDVDVLLINPPYPHRYGGGIVPPIGLCYLAASLRRIDANPSILDLALAFPNYQFKDKEVSSEFVKSFLNKRKKKPPILIGIGPLVTATLRPVHDIIEACRQEVESSIVIGGPLCSTPGISNIIGTYLQTDAYVVGDGETPIIQIWQSLINTKKIKNIPGVGLPGGLEPNPFHEQNLNQLPLPARDLLPKDGYKSSVRRSTGSLRMTVAFLSRGCPYSCTFCSAPLSSGRVIRRLSSDRISEDISACADSGFSEIIFYDDCLFVKSPTLEAKILEFTNSIRNSRWRGVFQIELRCDVVASLSEKALSALAEIGCRQINMGIEKKDVSQLRYFKKRLTPEVVRKACDRIASTCIRGAGTFILGGPNETLKDIEETIEFAESLPLDFAHFNPLAIYPGTTLFYQEFGSTKPDSWLELCLDPEIAPLGDILWKSPGLPLDKILKAVATAYQRFYTQDRLKRVLTKSPDHERIALETSYEMLSKKRSSSWIVKSESGSSFV